MLFVRLRLGLFGAVCCFVSTAPVASGASRCCWLLWALLVCFRSMMLVCARGLALRLGVCILGLPLLFVLLHLFPPSRHFVTFSCLPQGECARFHQTYKTCT